MDGIMNSTEVRSVLARNIKAFRGRRNWSQANLAEKTSLSVVYLSDIERGNKWPYLDSLIKLANALEVEIYELLKPDENIILNADSYIYKKYTAEINAILAKSIEIMEKNISKAMSKLQKRYIGMKNSELTD